MKQNEAASSSAESRESVLGCVWISKQNLFATPMALNSQSTRESGYLKKAKAAVDIPKKKLPGFMPSGQFSNRQKPAAEKLLISISNLAEQAMNLNMELGLLVRGGELPRSLAGHLQSPGACDLQPCDSGLSEVEHVMNTLTLRPHLGWFVVHGRQDIENSSVPTLRRGRISTHAVRPVQPRGYMP